VGKLEWRDEKQSATGLPAEWAWSGYDELVGDKHRYRLLTPALLWRKLGGGLDQKSFTQWYEATMRQKLENLAALRREDYWTSAKVVGDPGFVARAAGRKYRQQIVATSEGACYFFGRSSLVNMQKDPGICAPRKKYASIRNILSWEIKD
jgi:hypothetical protein